MEQKINYFNTHIFAFYKIIDLCVVDNLYHVDLKLFNFFMEFGQSISELRNRAIRSYQTTRYYRNYRFG